ncbi:F-box/FBD/LRR-repeat protein At5g53840 [Linum grandiflorum]
MKTVAAAGQQEDRFSDLPDEVIHQILYRIKSSKQPAQLAILSKRWNHLWLSYPVLEFVHHEWPMATTDENWETFSTAAGKKLSVPAVRITGSCPLDLLSGFLAMVTQEVRLRSGPHRGIVIPRELFKDDRFRGLKVVKLKRVLFPSGSSVSFGASLRVLSLKHVTFCDGDEILNSMIESASWLESLTLEHIEGIGKLQIRNCLNLKTLKAGKFDKYSYFEISGAESLEILHVVYGREEEFQVSLAPNNNVKVLIVERAWAMKSNEEVNKFISKFRRLESLKLIDRPLVPRLKINVSNHNFLRSIWMGYWTLESQGKVIEIDAPCTLSKFVLNVRGGSGFPDILINQADSEPVVQVSVRNELIFFSRIDWHELKHFLASLISRFQLTLEFVHCQKEIGSLTSNGDDQSPIPIIEHVKFPPDLFSLFDEDALTNNLFRSCHPKMISFTETRDEVAEKNVLQLQNMWKYLDSSCKSAKMMKRAINDDGIEEDREIDLVSFLGDPKRCWIVLDWH